MQDETTEKLIRDIIFWGIPLSLTPIILTAIISDQFIDNPVLALMYGCLIGFSIFFVFEMLLIFNRLDPFEEKFNKTRAEFYVI